MNIDPFDLLQFIFLLFLLYEKGNVTISHASLHMSLRHTPYLELIRSMLSCLLPSLQNGVFG